MGKAERQRNKSDSIHPSSHTPFHCLTTSEKATRYKCKHTFWGSCQWQIGHLLQRLSEKVASVKDKSLCDELSQIMVQNVKLIRCTYPEGVFLRYFGRAKASCLSHRCSTNVLESNDGETLPLPLFGGNSQVLAIRATYCGMLGVNEGYTSCFCQQMCTSTCVVMG